MDNRILGISEAVSLAAVIHAAQRGEAVARLMENGDIIIGTARSIGDSRGGFIQAGEDVRDACLRVTTDQGWEAFWPMHDLVKEYKETTFVTNYQR